MNLAPFLQAEPAVRVHVAFALVAAVTGIAVFAMRTGFGVALFVTIGVVISRRFVAKPRRRGHRQRVA